MSMPKHKRVRLSNYEDKINEVIDLADFKAGEK